MPATTGYGYSISVMFGALKRTLIKVQPGVSEQSTKIELIAHRGYTARYPENTLEGIRAAVDAGARWVEFDVQLTADGVPVLLHDPTLNRTTGQSGIVMELELAELQKFSPGEPRRLGEQFAGIRIPTLAQLIGELSAWPQVNAFVEIKQHSIDRFGSRFTVARVLEALQPCVDQCVVISFAAEAVAQASELSAARTGWAIRQFNGVTRNEATLLAPQFLFCDHRVIPAVSRQNPEPLWPGPWRWAVYEVGTPELAIRMAGIGADLIETFEIGTLIQHPRFAQDK